MSCCIFHCCLHTFRLIWSPCRFSQYKLSVCDHYLYRGVAWTPCRYLCLLSEENQDGRQWQKVHSICRTEADIDNIPTANTTCLTIKGPIQWLTRSVCTGRLPKYSNYIYIFIRSERAASKKTNNTRNNMPRWQARWHVESRAPTIWIRPAKFFVSPGGVLPSIPSMIRRWNRN